MFALCFIENTWARSTANAILINLVCHFLCALLCLFHILLCIGNLEFYLFRCLALFKTCIESDVINAVIPTVKVNMSMYRLYSNAESEPVSHALAKYRGVRWILNFVKFATSFDDFYPIKTRDCSKFDLCGTAKLAQWNVNTREINFPAKYICSRKIVLLSHLRGRKRHDSKTCPIKSKTTSAILREPTLSMMWRS